MTGSNRTYVSYIDKSREYYAAQGYDQPYRWAKNHETPFTALTKPLAECRVAIVTTAKRAGEAPLLPYSAPSRPQPASMATEHLSWHKEATTTDDVGSFLPLDHLAELVGEGHLGSLSPRFVGTPTLYSQRSTIRCAEDVRTVLIEDGVDLAILVPL